MRVAGIDIGSLSANCLIIADNNILSWSNTPVTPNAEETARRSLNETLHKANLSIKDLNYIVSTGYGRASVPFSSSHVTEISCHARGSYWLFPDTRTILDMGGQDCKAIRCDEKGKVTNFLMNDKCAAGTGRYLELIASTVGVPLEEIGPLSLEIKEEPVAIESYCAVFAQRDILIMLREGRYINDILAGACEAIVRRIRQLLEKVGVIAALSISGGIAKNIGVVKRLENQLGMKVRIAFDPQIVGALGAALFAGDRLQRSSEFKLERS